MKKNIILLVAAIALLMSSCSDTSKAKSLAKKYLEQNSNDGKIEIVSTGELEDYNYEFDEKSLAKMDVDLAKIRMDGEKDLMDIWADSNDDYSVSNYNEHKAEYEKYKKEYEDALEVYEKTENKVFPMKRIRCQ